MIETTGLTITETQLGDIHSVLDEMLTGAKASSVLLINSDDGSLIAARGPTDALDTTSLAALAAGAFASTREIARLVGEPEFTVLFHQGARHHVHVNLAGDHGLLMTLFTDDTTVGLVRLCARKSCLRIKQVLSD
jgi:predicted regulator of Ras-like GTPase activity (Roadblock/LC7/MglB family)